jgi:hypothetical protein
MKKINRLFFAFVFLYSLTGCNSKDGDSPIPYAPKIIILYTDTDGNLLKRENTSCFELLSITNSEGDSLGHWRFYPAMYGEYIYFDMDIDELFTNQSLKTERHYTVRYKITLHSSEARKEELELAYLSDVWGSFTEARYNGSRMKEAATIGYPVAGFGGTEPVAVLLPAANVAYIIIPVE